MFEKEKPKVLEVVNEKENEEAGEEKGEGEDEGGGGRGGIKMVKRAGINMPPVLMESRKPAPKATAVVPSSVLGGCNVGCKRVMKGTKEEVKRKCILQNWLCNTASQILY